MKVFTPISAGLQCPCSRCKAIVDRQSLTKFVLDKLNRMQKSVYTDHDDANPFDFEITSGFRCAEHNAAVGGAPASAHLSGVAFDIATNKSSARTYIIVDVAMIWEAQFIEVCPDHVHIDFRNTGTKKLIIGK